MCRAVPSSPSWRCTLSGIFRMIHNNATNSTGMPSWRAIFKIVCAFISLFLTPKNPKERKILVIDLDEEGRLSMIRYRIT